jgi:PAS domain S-box-containing protein
MAKARKPEAGRHYGPAPIASLPILDSLLEGCQILGSDWTYLYVNEAAAAHGRKRREELLGRSMPEVYPGIEETPMFERLRDCMENRRHQELENEFVYPDGSSSWFELRMEPVPEGVFVLSLDVTDRVRQAEAKARLEAQYHQAQKMEAVGRLAGGLAHDFNNLLSVILSYAELSSGKLRPGDPLRDDLREVGRAAESAADLTRQLLAIAVIGLNGIVAGLESLLGRLLGEDLALDLRLAADPDTVRADPGQVEQVLMNLAVNARDAMPEGGRLSIETAAVELDETYCDEHADVEPGTYVMLVVSDTGTGMDEETREHLFEPFFTTKEPDKGTGLGLATVYGIVQQSGGSIWVYSEPDEGTIFRIYLPRAVGAPEERHASPTISETAWGTETILVVEDQAVVRKVAERILRAAGYTVITVAGGEHALAVCERHREVRLLLTDVVLPAMSGIELVGRLRETRPDLRFLVMSGYTEDAVLRRGGLGPGTHFIAKPFTATELASRVRQILDA